MDDLIAGYRRFRAGTWRAERARFEELSRHGQRPRALVIACSDSRTDPQMVFNAAPGELFVIRNVANLAPPYGPDDQPHGVSSAIEFAVRSLRVRNIVIMGHAMCGGIHALLHGAPPEASDFVGPWVRLAEPARQRALHAPPEKQQDVCEHESVRLSLDEPHDVSLDQGSGGGPSAQAARLLLRYPLRHSASVWARTANFIPFPTNHDANLSGHPVYRSETEGCGGPRQARA